MEDSSEEMMERCATTVKEEPEIESPALVLVKEESMISNESWLDGSKEEPTSPLSVNTPREEPDEFEDHDMDMKREMVGKEEEFESPEETSMFCSSVRQDHVFFSECNHRAHIDCSAWSCSSQTASSSTQSLLGDMTAMNSQKHFLKSSIYSDAEILVPVSFESGRAFAVSPSSAADDAMNREEAADVCLSKELVDHQKTRNRQEKLPFKNECRGSPNHKETPYQTSALQPDPLRSSNCKRSFKCDQCEKTFKRNDHLIQHKRIHTGGRPFKCSQCGKAFTRSNDLTKHLQIHTGERPYKCSQCGKTFTQRSHLTTHLLKHTEDGPLKCCQCGKSFTQSNDLTKHLRIHTGERPYKCSQCGKSFTQRSHLTTHMHKHTGDRPFKCSECGKSFTQSSILSTHLWIHTKDRPFKCSQCGKSFARNSLLTRHMQTHRDRPSKCS